MRLRPAAPVRNSQRPFQGEVSAYADGVAGEGAEIVRRWPGRLKGRIWRWKPSRGVGVKWA